MVIDYREAKPGPPAGPVLGQAQIPLKEFCDEFNKRTSPILQGTMLFTKVFKHAKGGYDISVRAPSIVYLVKQVLADRGESRISIYDLYDLVRIRMQMEKILNTEKNKAPVFPSFHAATSCILGTLKSMGIKINLRD